MQTTDNFLNYPILFLDYDGVLHPDEVFNLHNRGPYLNAPGHALFEYEHTLVEILQEFEPLKIILSTSWVREFGFNKAKSFLCEELQARVIGGTYHNRLSQDGGWASAWYDISRYDQIRKWLDRNFAASWCAIDNDARGWPDSKMAQLIHTDDFEGLSNISKQEELYKKLSTITGEWLHFNSDELNP